ncbi:helix-turn-helix transcriptional regulator [Modestobacter marinus]|uniref:helix-turn-helix transcriptional regulator n=1 Tax=Modestobacter marinus TaxID=477641 RepID=UPI001C97021C|nr:helix-turn-helix domain-containing protein [Modestobacter marinus]
MESNPARVPSSAPADDGRTRDRVSALLLEHGAQTAAELAARLGVSPAAVRRHLDALLATGRVAEGVDVHAPAGRRGRGRPARRFALTEAGRAAFPHAYDDLALTALRFVAAHGGPEAVREVAEQQLSGLEQRCSAAVQQAQAASAEPVDRAQVVAAALTTEGYAAMATSIGSGAISSGEQLCQHHCPVAHVAAEFPQLCDAETAVISRLVGTHVQRLATIAHGDGVCTTHIPGQRTPRSGNKAAPTDPVPAGRATAATAGASTRSTPLIDRERTPA